VDGEVFFTIEEAGTIDKSSNGKNMVERARSQLAAVRNTLYFNTGWTGPSPACVLEEQKRVLDWLAADGVSHHVYEQLKKDIEMLRGRLARYLGADREEIAITRSTTEALNIVLGGIDWRPGQKIVTTTVEHGAGLVPAYVIRDRYGVEVDIVDLSDGRDALRRLARAIDDRTRLVSVSHVGYNTGLRLPLKELSKVVAERGAELLVDGAQAVGVFRIDLHDLGCDYYAFPGHKWMLGPDATGALYIRRDRIAGLATSLAGNESAKRFDRNGHVSFYADARRFEMCDFNASLISGWIKALDFIEESGQENIERAIKKNAHYLKRRLAEIKRLNVLTPRAWEKSAGLVSIEIQGKRAKAVFRHLLKKGIVARYTHDPSYLRISVNYFNTREELDTLADALRQLSAS
jgi:L-cysteine/cystine lyase